MGAGAASAAAPAARRASLRSILRLRVSLFLLRRASNWSVMLFSRCFSAFNLWMDSMRMRLFLNTLPFTCQSAR